MGTVPTMSLVFMGVSGLCGIAIPVVLFIVLRKRYRADVLPFVIGCAVMLLFALVLESLVHQVVLLGTAAGAKIQSNLWLYALYGGLMAGIFEETGRFAAFKTVLRKSSGNNNALMYGAGHGGFEAFSVLTLTMISNIIIAALINSGTADMIMSTVPAELQPQVEAQFMALVTTESWQFLVGILERVFAVVLQLALSVIVWHAAKTAGKWYLYPVAILLHALVDGVMVIIAGLGAPIMLVEAFVALGAAAVALFAWRVAKKAAATEIAPVAAPVAE